MSGLYEDKYHSSENSDFDSNHSDSQSNQEQTPPDSSAAAWSEQALPTPSFEPEERIPEPLTRLPVFHALDWTGEANADTGSRRVYKVSPAESDWPDYPRSPDEENTSTEPEESGPSGWQTTWAVIREVGETILLTLIIFFLIQTVVRNFRVVGTSMLSNLHDGQYLVIDKISYNSFLTSTFGIGGPQRGDVIVFEPPNRPGDDYVKRIIGLPGETVEVRNGRVFINGQPLEEPFQPLTGSYSTPPQVVPEGQVFVLGDNRNNSNDSHTWGTLPMENIVGRAWLSYWPPEQWGLIPRNAPTEQATLKHFLDDLIPSANAEEKN